MDRTQVRRQCVNALVICAMASVVSYTLTYAIFNQFDARYERVAAPVTSETSTWCAARPGDTLHALALRGVLEKNYTRIVHVYHVVYAKESQEGVAVVTNQGVNLTLSRVLGDVYKLATRGDVFERVAFKEILFMTPCVSGGSRLDWSSGMRIM